MATLTISALALGMDAGRIRVHIRLADGDYNTVAGTYGSGSIVERITEYTASDGTLSVDLVPNADITPANTYYVVWVGQERFLIEKTSATQTLSAALVADPNILESVLATTRLSDVSDTAATGTGTALLWNSSTSQWEPESDLSLVTPVYAAGAVTGGVIRRATSLIIPWDYTQTVLPADSAVGTAVLVQWDATLNDANAYLGPLAQTGWFGPRGVFQLEGRVNYGADQTSLMIEPLGYFDGLRVANVPGTNRALTPAWSFASSRMILADDGVVTLNRNDTNEGGAAFADTKALITLNAGEIDGTTVSSHHMTSFLSASFMSGNVAIAKRVGLDVKDINRGVDSYFVGGNNLDIIRTSEGLEDADADVSTCEEQIGVRIRALAAATRNIGIQNESATVETPLGSTVASAAATIRIDATTVVVSNTSGGAVTLTSVPTIAAGLAGQRITVINESAYPVTIQGESALAGSNVAVTRNLRQGRPVTLVWDASLDQWCEVGAHQDSLTVTEGTKRVQIDALADGGAFSIFNGSSDLYPVINMSRSDFFGATAISLGPGGATIPDTVLSRGSAGVWKIATTGNAAASIDNISAETFVERADPSAPAANTGVLYVRDNGSGKTQLCVRFPTGAVQVIATEP